MHRTARLIPAPAQIQRLVTHASMAVLLLAAGSVQAQTSGTLTSMSGSALNYSTAPWVITSGPGSTPGDGGVATFSSITSPIPGTVVLSSNVKIDMSPTLSQINFDSAVTYTLSAVTGNSIVAGNGGLTLNAMSTMQNAVVNGDGLAYAFGAQISSSISGGGSAGLIKAGAGNVYLLGANSYTGGTHINGGQLSVGGSAAIGDSVFGAAGPGNGLSFNGGSVFFNTSGGLTTARDVFIDAGGAKMVTNTSTTLSGVVSGSGTLTVGALSGGTSLTLTEANTFTGATVLRGPTVANIAYPSLILSGNGSLASGSSYDVQGALALDNSALSVNNRLSDTASLTLRGASFLVTGNATSGLSETVGAVTLANGYSNIVITPGASAANSLTMASLNRANNSTVTFRGTGLGGTPTGGVANIYINAAPTLVGGGGAAGSTSVSIIPFAIGRLIGGDSVSESGQAGSSFVTYGANGVRALATNEYATALGLNSTDNVRLTSMSTAPAVSTVNSLLLAPAAFSTVDVPFLAGGTINVTSGAVLYSQTSSSIPQGGFVGSNLNFGGAEGVITNTSILTLSGVLSGSGGLTLTSATPTSYSGRPTLNLTAANTYSGNTTINAGMVGFSGTIANGVAGSFGTSGSVILNGGNYFAGIVATAATTVERDIDVVGSGLNYIAQVGSGGFNSNYNGNIHLGGSVIVGGAVNVSANAFNFNGTISGTGAVYDGGFTYAVFNGNNTYSGGTILTGGSFHAGSDTAFGTGTITWVAAAGLGAEGTGPRTLANKLMFSASPFFVGSAPLTFTGTVDINGVAGASPRIQTFNNTALTTFAGVVSNGTFHKAGLGALALNSDTGNTFTGGFVNLGNATTASAIYANNSSGSAFGTGAVSIGATNATVYSTLAGNFSTAGATRIVGRLSPGNGDGLTAATAGLGSIGAANFETTLTFSSAANSSLYLEIASATSFDTVNVGGLLTLNGTVYIATADGYSIHAGDTFDFMNFGSIDYGTVSFNMANATLDAGVTLDTSMFASTGIVTATAAVPEPSSYAMLLAGLGAVGFVARRRRQAAAGAQK